MDLIVAYQDKLAPAVCKYIMANIPSVFANTFTEEDMADKNTKSSYEYLANMQLEYRKSSTGTASFENYVNETFTRSVQDAMIAMGKVYLKDHIIGERPQVQRVFSDDKVFKPIDTVILRLSGGEKTKWLSCFNENLNNVTFTIYSCVSETEGVILDCGYKKIEMRSGMSVVVPNHCMMPIRVLGGKTDAILLRTHLFVFSLGDEQSQGGLKKA